MRRSGPTGMWLLSALAALLTFSTLTRSALAATISVTTNSMVETNDSVCGLSEAVKTANLQAPSYFGCTRVGSGDVDTITLPANTYSTYAEVTVTRSMEIVGVDPATTVLNTGAVFGFAVRGLAGLNPTLTLRNLTVQRRIEQALDVDVNGIFVNGTGETVGAVLDNVHVSGCDKGIQVSDGSLKVSGSDFLNNQTGILLEIGVADIDTSYFSDNGTGIFSSDATLNVTQSIIQNSSAGGIRAFANSSIGGTVVIRSSTIKGNKATLGGGIMNSNEGTIGGTSALFVYDSAIQDNTATNGGGVWNGIDTGSPVHLVRCLVAHNTATQDGGGVYSAGQGYFSNTTFRDNQAARGGGYFQNAGTENAFFHCTIASNKATNIGGGLDTQQANSSRILHDTVIAYNIAYNNGTTASPSDVSCPIASQVPSVEGNDYNIVGNVGCATGFCKKGQQCSNGGTGTDLVDVDPKLDLSATSGVYPLQLGSPAIDMIPVASDSHSGSDYDGTVDERGMQRPQGTGVDSGAFELQPSDMVLGFEVISQWTSPQAPLSLNSSKKTQGLYGLNVGGAGYRVVNGAALRTPLLPPTSNIRLDVFVPGNQPNPSWLGAVQMYTTCASANLYNVYMGQVELSGKPTNAFSTLAFSVPAQVRAALGQNHPDCFFSIAVNANRTPTAPVLDNLRFVP